MTITDPVLHAQVNGVNQIINGPRTWRSPVDIGTGAGWTATERSVTVRSDPLGFHPLYYAATPTDLYVSPSPVALARSGGLTEPDHDALAVFVRLGFFLGEDTPWRAVRAMPPSGGLTWQSGRHALSREPIRITRFDGTADEAASTLAHLTRQAVSRRLPTSRRLALPLSGGRDSRHLLLELLHVGHNPQRVVTSIGVPPAYAADANAARTVAADLGLSHELVQSSSCDLTDELAKNELTGFCADEHGWFPPLGRRMGELTDTYYDGLGGDVLTASQVLGGPVDVAIRSDDAIGLLRSLAMIPESVLARILTPTVYARWSVERAVDRLRQEIVKHSNAVNPTVSFLVFNRTRREVALLPFRLAASYVPGVFTPFCDVDLVTWALGLPTELCVGGTLHDRALRHAHPHATWPLAPRPRQSRPPAPSLRTMRDMVRHFAKVSSGPVHTDAVQRAVVIGRIRGEQPWWVTLPILLHQLHRSNLLVID